MAPMVAKLLVKFEKNSFNTTKFVEDSSETLEEINSSIGFVGYVGIYESEDTFNIYVQLLSGKRIVPSTLRKKLSNLGKISSDPEKFIKFEGELVDELGDFLRRGRKSTQKKISNSYNSVNNSHNTTNNDNSVNNTYNDNRVVNLHINALGDEDLSHMTAEKLTSIVKDEKIVYSNLCDVCSEYDREKMLKSYWEKHLRERREMVREYDRQHSNGEKTLAESFGIVDEKYEKGEEPDKNSYKKDYPKDNPPEYDSDSDSEESFQIQKDLVTKLCYDFGADVYKAAFFNDFEIMLYNNPHNGNVLASTDKGVFEYFDGKIWVKSDKSEYFDKVIDPRLKKAREISLNMKESGKLSAFLDGHIYKMLYHLAHSDGMDRKNLVKKSIVESENNKRRLANVRKTKKIRKISASSLEDKTRYSVWDKLED